MAALLVALVRCAPSERVDERTDAAIDQVTDVCTPGGLSGGDDAFGSSSGPDWWSCEIAPMRPA